MSITRTLIALVLLAVPAHADQEQEDAIQFLCDNMALYAGEVTRSSQAGMSKGLITQSSQSTVDADPEGLFATESPWILDRVYKLPLQKTDKNVEALVLFMHDTVLEDCLEKFMPK